jgi:branched-chain amino acid transport system substrate-binding protein
VITPGDRPGADARDALEPGQASPGQLAAISATLGQKYAGGPDHATAAVAYAVAQVLTDALARAGSANPGRLNTAIAQTHAPTTAGLITFNPFTHTATTPSSVAQWQGGKLVQVQPPAAGARFGAPAAGLG